MLFRQRKIVKSCSNLYILNRFNKWICYCPDFHLIQFHSLINYYELTCCIENSVDPDQLASSEARMILNCIVFMRVYTETKF